MSPLPIQGIRYSSALTDLFSLTGKLPLKLDETVVPVAVVADLSPGAYGPSATASIAVAAGGAGNRSMVEISLPQVPSAQGAAAIVDAAVFQASAAAQTIFMGPSPGMPAPTSFAEKTWLDVGMRGDPLVQVAGKNDAAAIAGVVASVRRNVRIMESLLVPLGWVLQANPDTGLQQGLMLRPGNDNETMIISFYWRERLPR